MGRRFRSFDEAWSFFLARDEPLENFLAGFPDELELFELAISTIPVTSREHDPAPLQEALLSLREADVGCHEVTEVLRVEVPAARSTVLQPWRVLEWIELDLEVAPRANRLRAILWRVEAHLERGEFYPRPIPSRHAREARTQAAAAGSSAGRSCRAPGRFVESRAWRPQRAGATARP